MKEHPLREAHCNVNENENENENEPFNPVPGAAAKRVLQSLQIGLNHENIN